MANTTVIQIRLPDEELARVQKRAKDAGLAPAAWVKALIMEELGVAPSEPAKVSKPAKKAAKKTTTAKKKAANANPESAKEGEGFTASAAPAGGNPPPPTSPQVIHGTVDIDPDKPVRRTAHLTSPDPRLMVGIPTEPAASPSKCAHPKAQLKKFSWGSVCGVCNNRVR